MAVKVCRHCDKLIRRGGATRQPFNQAKTIFSCCSDPVCLKKEYHRRNINPRLDLHIVVRKNNTWVRLSGPP